MSFGNHHAGGHQDQVTEGDSRRRDPVETQIKRIRYQPKPCFDTLSRVRRHSRQGIHAGSATLAAKVGNFSGQ